MIEVRPALETDLVYVDSLQRKNAEELAFYPKAAFEREIENRRIVVAWLNGEPAGYVYHGALDTVCKIHQACIQYDLRGQLYGAELVNWVRALAVAARCLSVTLRCGSNIEANGFWARMGFECEAILPGGVRRRRDINCWRLTLASGLFATTSMQPSDRKADASLWNRNKGEKKANSCAANKCGNIANCLRAKRNCNPPRQGRTGSKRGLCHTRGLRSGVQNKKARR